MTEDPKSNAAPTAEVVRVDDGGGDDLGARVSRMQETLRLPEYIVRDLLKVSGTTEIIVVADDSRSMNAVADTGDTRQPSTYWQELVQVMYQLVTMLLVIENSGGFWLKFLNDENYYHVSNKEQLDPIFATKPKAYGGKTPLRASLEPILQRSYNKNNDENKAEETTEAEDILCLVLTDGVPTDCTFAELASIVRAKPSTVYVSFVMCTENLDVVDKYNKYIDPIPGTDVTDDYVSERNEARRVGNSLTPFQWLAKMLLVKFDHFDKLDERKMKKHEQKLHSDPNDKPVCCTIL